MEYIYPHVHGCFLLSDRRYYAPRLGPVLAFGVEFPLRVEDSFQITLFSTYHSTSTQYIRIERLYVFHSLSDISDLICTNLHTFPNPYLIQHSIMELIRLGISQESLARIPDAQGSYMLVFSLTWHLLLPLRSLVVEKSVELADGCWYFPSPQTFYLLCCLSHT